MCCFVRKKNVLNINSFQLKQLTLLGSVTLFTLFNSLYFIYIYIYSHYRMWHDVRSVKIKPIGNAVQKYDLKRWIIYNVRKAVPSLNFPLRIQGEDSIGRSHFNPSFLRLLYSTVINRLVQISGVLRPIKCGQLWQGANIQGWQTSWVVLRRLKKTDLRILIQTFYVDL